MAGPGGHGGFFVRQLIGLTDEVLSEIEARQKKKKDRTPATPLYQSISTMKEFNMTSFQWHNLSRLDKKLLHYHRVMESHYLDQMHEEGKREREREEERRKFMYKLPTQIRRGR